MASKYDNVRRLMDLLGYGTGELYRDTASNGNVILKWYSKHKGQTLAQRKKEAAEVMECFAGIHPFKNGTFDYVTKVVVRNATASRVNCGVVETWQDLDKVCVYIDRNKM